MWRSVIEQLLHCSLRTNYIHSLWDSSRFKIERDNRERTLTHIHTTSAAVAYIRSSMSLCSMLFSFETRCCGNRWYTGNLTVCMQQSCLSQQARQGVHPVLWTLVWIRFPLRVLMRVYKNPLPSSVDSFRDNVQCKQKHYFPKKNAPIGSVFFIALCAHFGNRLTKIRSSVVIRYATAPNHVWCFYWKFALILIVHCPCWYSLSPI